VVRNKTSNTTGSLPDYILETTFKTKQELEDRWNIKIDG
jgi:hypothetical protein